MNMHIKYYEKELYEVNNKMDDIDIIIKKLNLEKKKYLEKHNLLINMIINERKVVKEDISENNTVFNIPNDLS